MPDYKKLIVFFDEYIAHYREFLSFEYQKADMLNKNQKMFFLLKTKLHR